MRLPKVAHCPGTQVEATTIECVIAVSGTSEEKNARVTSLGLA